MTEMTTTAPGPEYGTPGPTPGQAGAPEMVRTPVNYFMFVETHTFYMPDGEQWIKFKVMAEGDKAKFQKRTNQDVKLDRQSGQASFRVDQADQRHELIKLSVVDWYMFAPNPATGQMEQVPFSLSDRHPTGMNLQNFLAYANPAIIEDLELAIRKANPWMQEDMSVEEIDKEIERLEDLKRSVKERESGNS